MTIDSSGEVLKGGLATDHAPCSWERKGYLGVVAMCCNLDYETKVFPAGWHAAGYLNCTGHSGEKMAIAGMEIVQPFFPQDGLPIELSK